MKRLLPTFVCAAALLTPASASAADSSWDTSKDDSSTRQSGLVTSKFAGAAKVDKSKCNAGNVVVRYRSGGKWSKFRAVRKCSSARVRQAALTRDAKNGRLFVVWSQVDPIKRSRSGVYMVVSRNGGRSFSKPKVLVKTPKSLAPAQVAVAARAKRLWVMRTMPRRDRDRTARFVLEGFSQVTGRFEKRNLAKSGQYRADTLSRTALSIHAGDIGLLLVWQRTGADNVERTYSAASEHYFDKRSLKRMRLRYEGLFKGSGFKGKSRLVVGEDDRPYLFTESREFNSATGKFTADVEAWRWSWVSDSFQTALPGSAKVLHVDSAPLVDWSSFAYQVGRDRSVYIGYEDYSFANAERERTCLSVTGSQCVRSTAPEAAPTTLFVYRATRTGQRYRAAVPWPRIAASPGTTVSQWRQNGSGMDFITNSFGGTRLVTELASSTAGSVNAQRRITVSDPLQFAAAP